MKLSQPAVRGKGVKRLSGINYRWAGLLALVPVGIFADVLDQPLHTANRNPFVQLFGLPSTMSADVLPPKQSEIILSVEAANHFSLDSAQDESIFIDGEHYRIEWSARFSLTERLEWGVSVPYLIYDGGGLDGFIDGWHNTFNLPDGDRNDYPKHQIDMTYTDNGETTVFLQDRTDSLGDIQLLLGYALAEQWTVRAGVKLPTGDVDQLSGSDGTDLFAGMYFSSMPNSDWRWHANIGAIWMEQGDAIAERQEDWAAFGSLAAIWLASDNIALKIQLDGHTAFYDSELTPLGKDSAQLILGGSWRFVEKASLDISVSEDIITETAPDVVFQLAIRTRL